MTEHMTIDDHHDPKLPQWVRSRLRAVSRRPGCGSTHSACRCFIEKIIRLEAELAELRGKKLFPQDFPPPIA